MHCIGWDQPVLFLPASPQGSQADHLPEHHQVILASLIISLATCRLVGVTRIQLTAEPYMPSETLDFISGALDFINDYFPRLKELFIHVVFDRRYYDYWWCRPMLVKLANLKFIGPSISLLRQRGVDVFVQPKAKSGFQIETFSQFSFM